MKVPTHNQVIERPIRAAEMSLGLRDFDRFFTKGTSKSVDTESGRIGSELYVRSVTSQQQQCGASQSAKADTQVATVRRQQITGAYNRLGKCGAHRRVNSHTYLHRDNHVE
jgi:hypothetical protein